MAIRVLHVLDHSWPVLDGYSQRSRSVIAAQRSLGFQPAVVTSPLHNLDDPASGEVDLDSIHHFRVPNRSGVLWRAIRHRWPLFREAAVIRLLEKRIRSLLAKGNFDLVHAHSPALCGLAALRAARAQHLPFVYEVRSFWEDGVAQSPSALRYRLGRALETYVVRRANAIVGISRPILQDLASRGIPEARLFYVPNGVDSVRFTPRPRDAALSAKLRVDGIPTLGFLGTLFPWEGVPWLVQAAAALHARGVSFKLLIVGDGVESNAIRNTIARENAGDYVSYLGRVSFEDVQRYYSAMDVLVYPRRSLRITEFVSPLKPLEAMALAKPVLGSAVGGMRELIEPGVTGVLFEAGNVDDFCRHAQHLLADEKFRRELGGRARKAVSEERNWETLTRRYEGVYDTAMRNARQRA